MADVFQGDPLPAITTTTQAQTTAPEFYTNYLQDIANLGQAGVQQGGIAGFSPLQQQAMAMAPTAAFAGLGTMGTGAGMASTAGTTTAPDVIKSYMNPYTQYVTDEMERLQKRNLQESLLPAMKGAAGAMGQFGSQRQYQATEQLLRDVQADLLGKQYGALSSGYSEALRGAQADLGRSLQAADILGGLGARQQQAATTGLGTLSALGGQEQALGQRMLDYPMTAAQNYAKLLQGYQIPTGETKQVTGSQGYATSPLAQITGLLAALGSFVSPTARTVTVQDVAPKAEGGLIEQQPEIYIPEGAAYHDGQGNFYDADGNLVR